jgi:hypothetical protein
MTGGTRAGAAAKTLQTETMFTNDLHHPPAFDCLYFVLLAGEVFDAYDAHNYNSGHVFFCQNDGVNFTVKSDSA